MLLAKGVSLAPASYAYPDNYQGPLLPEASAVPDGWTGGDVSTDPAGQPYYYDEATGEYFSAADGDDGSGGGGAGYGGDGSGYAGGYGGGGDYGAGYYWVCYDSGSDGSCFRLWGCDFSG